MKYEEIKIGDVFRYQNDEETVISKSDKHRIITTIDCYGGPTSWLEEDLYLLEPRKEEPTLELVLKAVKEIGDFIVEQTESGVIILTPLS